MKSHLLPLPPTNKSAFEFEGTHDKILFFHGFTGTPYEIRAIATYLNEQREYACYAPVTPGHAQTPKELNLARAGQWVLFAEDQLENLYLKNNKQPIIISGFSMGGLLASHLAAKFPDKIKALILLAPAYFLTSWPNFGAKIAKLGMKHFVPIVDKHGGCDIANPEGRKRNPTLTKVPVHALAELERLRLAIVPKVAEIACPTFVAYGKGDKTVNNAKTQKLLENHPNLRSVTLNNSQHIIGLDFDRGELGEKILEFCDSL